MATSISIVDLVFFGFGILTVFMAFLRGFIKEIFAFFNWVIAFTLSYALAPYVSKLFLFYTKSTLIADISARTAIFMISFVIFIFATGGMSSDIKEKMNDKFDRSLGVLFGLIKTLLIFGLVYSVMINLYGFLLGNKSQADESQLPKWLTEAKSYNIMRTSGEIVDPVVKVFFDAVVRNFDRVASDVIEEVKPDGDIGELIEKVDEGPVNGAAAIKTGFDAVKSSSEKGAEKIEEKGYNKKDIEKMNRLIEIVQ